MLFSRVVLLLLTHVKVSSSRSLDHLVLFLKELFWDRVWIHFSLLNWILAENYVATVERLPILQYLVVLDFESLSIDPFIVAWGNRLIIFKHLHLLVCISIVVQFYGSSPIEERLSLSIIQYIDLTTFKYVLLFLTLELLLSICCFKLMSANS